MHRTKISAEFKFGGHRMWSFAESRRVMQNVNKAMQAGET